MKNLLKETKDLLLSFEKDFSCIECAELFIEKEMDYLKHIILGENHSNFDLEKFEKELDFEYDNGFGGQCVYGYVSFYDGTWIERHEYDGSEWWEYKSTPKTSEKNGLIINTLDEDKWYMQYDIIESIEKKTGLL